MNIPFAPSTIRRIGPALALVVLTCALYAPSLDGDFLWDDDTFLTHNPLIHASDGLYRFWLTRQAPDYFPLTSSSLWLEWRLWGAWPMGYRLVNLLLHAVGVVLLWRVLTLLRVPGAWLAALVFAAHPVNVESVAWITQRKNTLPMVFFLLAALCWLQFYAGGKRGWYLGALLSFLAALLSKTAVAPFPLLQLGYAWYARGRITGRDLLLTLPFLALSLGLGAVTFWFQYYNAGAEGVRDDGALSRLALAAGAAWFYLDKALWPVGLSFVYPRWPTGTPGLLGLASVLLWPALLGGLWLARHRVGRGPLAAMVYFLVMLLPVLGFANIYFMRYSLVADHWQYFAIIGPIALLVGGLAHLWHRFGPPERSWAVAAAVLLVLPLAVLTFERQRVFRDSVALFRDALRVNPHSTYVHNLLGVALAKAEEMERARERFEKAVELDETHAEAWHNLGHWNVLQGNLDVAAEHYETGLTHNPDHVESRIDLAMIRDHQARSEEAVTHLLAALEVQPNHARAANTLAWLRATHPDAGVRDATQAVELAQRAVDLSGGTHPGILDTLAAAQAEAGRYAEAADTARRALALMGDAPASLVDEVQQRLAAYESGKPWREPTH